MDAIIYQVGDFPGLKYCMQSIQKWSPESRIHVLGEKIPWMAPIPIAPFSNCATAFDKIYKHHSVNPREFELRCFQRWMVIWEYAKSIGLNEFFVCDSDVLVFSDLSKEAEPWRNCGFTMPMGSSFVFSLRALKMFINFCFWYYEHDENTFRKMLEVDYMAGRITAISDMSLSEHIHKLVKARWTTNINLAVQVDPNMGLIHAHHSKDGLKRINWIMGQPYGVTLDGRVVRFICLHCWGRAKSMMAEYLRQSNESL